MKANTLRFFITAILMALIFSADARVFLVSVGIADYSGYPSKASDLTLTTKDAQTIVDLYSANASLEYSLLLDDKATKERIVKAIRKVFSQADEDDQVVFFFSGHGYPGGFCAYDGSLSYDDIRKAMAKSKSKNKMMFVDACRSGGIRVDRKSSRGEVEAARKANVMLFLSSRTNENSNESSSMQNGFFTTYLQKGLRGEADANQDSIITAKELFIFVNSGVARFSGGRQHPVMWGNFNDNMVVMKW